jgi:hypothetical protein
MSPVPHCRWPASLLAVLLPALGSCSFYQDPPPADDDSGVAGDDDDATTPPGDDDSAPDDDDATTPPGDDDSAPDDDDDSATDDDDHMDDDDHADDDDSAAACYDDPAPSTCSSTVICTETGQAVHETVGTDLTYPETPPNWGDHWGVWAIWGEFSTLPEEVWLHNLEHGAIALLYEPSVPSTTVDDLRAWAQGVPDDDGGNFRWVLAPYPGLPSNVAAVSWGWTLLLDCADTAALDWMAANHYRDAPEDVGSNGSWTDDWLGE